MRWMSCCSSCGNFNISNADSESIAEIILLECSGDIFIVLQICMIFSSEGRCELKMKKRRREAKAEERSR